MGSGIGLFQLGGLQAWLTFGGGYPGNNRDNGGGRARFAGMLEVWEVKCVGGGISICGEIEGRELLLLQITGIADGSSEVLPSSFGVT